MSDAPQIPPSTPFVVSLTLERWRALLDVLADGQFRRVIPFVSQIARQLSQQMQHMSGAMRGNGAMPEQPQRPEAG